MCVYVCVLCVHCMCKKKRGKNICTPFLFTRFADEIEFFEATEKKREREGKKEKGLIEQL